MDRQIPLYEGCSFLGGRGVAYRVRTRAAQVLATNSHDVVVLDFAHVVGVSHSFADELLSPLTDLLGSEVPMRVRLMNCLPSVRGDLESVAEMHGLEMPAAEASSVYA